ncbi:MAG: hypothetical protein JRH01_18560 [Deltaproteobacteria bacterium]|nr:hypothetical protein [Deltaproteobacteria bacterium]MBW2421976.1 hypothetical protein [Deltaproteobacteria bacterium]
MTLCLRSMCVLVILAFAAPALSAEPFHIYRCELDDEASEDDAEALAKQWLAAARKVKGGEGMKVTLLFPVAVAATGQIDFLFVMSTPSFSDWGIFWDNYNGSAADAADALNDGKVVCPDSALWERVVVEAK